VQNFKKGIESALSKTKKPVILVIKGFQGFKLSSNYSHSTKYQYHFNQEHDSSNFLGNLGFYKKL